MKRIHQMSLEEKMQMLKEDFLDRDQTTFVKIRRTGRLGWESSIPEGAPYSDYILSPASDEELIKNSYRLAEDMIKVMDTPFKVRVMISPDSSRTDGKTALQDASFYIQQIILEELYCAFFIEKGIDVVQVVHFASVNEA
jgi:hypothetical protein